jgi:GT2 family glycosyltransferase
MKYFSIVIPVAPERDAEILDSLRKVNFPKNQFEIIIEKGKNPSRNRNIGAKKARGKIIAFLDDDAVVDSDLLGRAKEFFDKHKETGIAGGPQLTPEDDKFFAKACGEVFSSYFGAFSMSNRYKKGKLNLNADENSLTSANMFVRAKDFKKIGGFNEELFPGEDPEFLARAKLKGINIAYSPEIIIYHRRRSNLSGFTKQFFNYGKVRLSKEKFAGTKLNIVFLAPLFFTVYTLFLPVLAILSKYCFIPLAAYFAIAFLISIPKIFKNLSYPLLLPFLYFLTHFSYGLGMLYSLFKKS